MKLSFNKQPAPSTNQLDMFSYGNKPSHDYAVGDFAFWNGLYALPKHNSSWSILGGGNDGVDYEFEIEAKILEVFPQQEIIIGKKLIDSTIYRILSNDNAIFYTAGFCLEQAHLVPFSGMDADLDYSELYYDISNAVFCFIINSSKFYSQDEHGNWHKNTNLYAVVRG